MLMRRRLACCTRDRGTSIDFDDHEKVMTYNGLERCITNSHSYDNESGTSRGDGCGTDSYDEDASSCCSSNNPSVSFSSHWAAKRDNRGPNDWEEEFAASPEHFYIKEKPAYATQFTDLETMKEKFAKLLLGEDITGGSKGVSTALAISNAISNLAASVFGELWKLEPLPEERKKKWEREMDWLLSPTNYMIELVPAKQNGSNGSTLEIMTPKARADIHMNLPALQKLDSMLLETLDSMVDNEFWYAEVGSRAEGRSRSAGQSKRWWLPSPHVPAAGLSDNERTKLLNKGKLVNQVFKAAKAINDSILLEMSVPEMIKDALPKTGKECLGEELYRMITAESTKARDIIDLLNLQSDHHALETINKLEAAILAWKERISEQSNGKSTPVRTSWSFMKDSLSEMDKMEILLNRAKALLQQLKIRYPNLPQTFLDVIKIQYGKDIGHSILEAYSRVLGNLAFCILSRLGDILQEDILSNPNSPMAKTNILGLRIPGMSDSPTVQNRARHSLIDQMNKVDGSSLCSRRSFASDMDSIYSDARLSSVTATPSHSRVWCIGRDACSSLSAENSP